MQNASSTAKICSSNILIVGGDVLWCISWLASACHALNEL